MKVKPIVNSVLTFLINFFLPKIIKDPLGKNSPEGGLLEICSELT